jgi:hypothetical protein
MPNTVDAILLVGWMEKDAAIKYLQQECYFDPPLTVEQAEALWREKRDAVEALGNRPAPAPVPIPMDPEEDRVARKFVQHFNRTGAQNIKEVMKIDPMGLVIHQPYVVLDRAREHAPKISTRDGWIRHCLSTDPPSPLQLQMRCAPNAVDAEIPHGEFMFAMDPLRGFGIQEFMKHVTVNAFRGRLWLWSGYHRSYARIASVAPDAMDRSLLVVRTTDGDFLVASNSPNQGLRDMLRGLRPPLFRDFFDEALLMRVKLHRKRYQLQIRAQVVGVNV